MMVSGTAHVSGSILSPLARFVAAIDSVSIESVLTLIDTALVLSGALVAIVFLWRMKRRARSVTALGMASEQNVREDSIAIVFAAYWSAALIGSMAASAGGFAEDSVAAMLLGGGLANVVGIAACALVVTKHWVGGVRSFIFGGRGDGRRIAFPTVVTVVAAVGLSPVVLTVTAMVFRLFNSDYKFEAHSTLEALGDPNQSTGFIVALWVMAAVLAPVAEECFFRGILQTFLTDMLRSRRLAILLSAVAFGLVHFPQPYAVPAMIVLGVMLGYLYDRTGALISPIVVHVAFNVKTLVWDALMSGSG